MAEDCGAIAIFSLGLGGDRHWTMRIEKAIMGVTTFAKVNRAMDTRAALMTLTVTEYKHIQTDERGNALIMGSTMKVVELVTSHLADGWGADDLHEQYPHLSLGQIYSALAYYWDHKKIIDAEIKRQLEYAETLRQQSPPSPIVNKLRTQGLLA